MQWDKGTETILNGWLQSQQKMWGNWWDMMAGSTQNGHPGTFTNPMANGQPATPNFNPMFEVWSSMAEGWRNYLQQSLTAYTPQMNDAARLSMEQFMASQTQAQQLFRMTTDAWQAIMATATSPAEWQQSLTSYLEGLRQQLMTGFNAGQMTQNSAELWQIYNQEMQKLTQPWLSLWAQSPQLGMGAGQRNGSTALTDVTNLYLDAVNQTMGRMANIPSIGLTRELNEKVNRGFLYWQDNQRVNAEYQQVLLNTLVNAFEAFMQKLLEMAKTGKPIDSQNELLTLWVEVADEQFLQLFHSAHYAEVQGRYVNSSMVLRRQQRELTEVLLRMNDLPTQSALDEAHHNIFLLRKEVKALQKAVHALQTAPGATELRTPVPTTASSPKAAKLAKPAKVAKAPRSRPSKPSEPAEKVEATSEEVANQVAASAEGA